MARDLRRIGEKARKDPKTKFTSIYHFVTDKALARLLRGDRAGSSSRGRWSNKGRVRQGSGEESRGPGREAEPDGVQTETSEPKLIPKAGSKKKRPIGIPSLEDKIVQKAMADVMGQIYETEFCESSYGYRPGRTGHDALDELGRTIQRKKVNYVVEADIKGFFDHVNQNGWRSSWRNE